MHSPLQYVTEENTFATWKVKYESVLLKYGQP